MTRRKKLTQKCFSRVHAVTWYIGYFLVSFYSCRNQFWLSVFPLNFWLVLQEWSNFQPLGHMLHQRLGFFIWRLWLALRGQRCVLGSNLLLMRLNIHRFCGVWLFTNNRMVAHSFKLRLFIFWSQWLQSKKHRDSQTDTHSHHFSKKLGHTYVQYEIRKMLSTALHVVDNVQIVDRCPRKVYDICGSIYWYPWDLYRNMKLFDIICTLSIA